MSATPLYNGNNNNSGSAGNSSRSYDESNGNNNAGANALRNRGNTTSPTAPGTGAGLGSPSGGIYGSSHAFGTAPGGGRHPSMRNLRNNNNNNSVSGFGSPFGLSSPNVNGEGNGGTYNAANGGTFNSTLSSPGGGYNGNSFRSPIAPSAALKTLTASAATAAEVTLDASSVPAADADALLIPVSVAQVPARFRPKARERRSRESFIMLRVEAIVLFIAFISTAAMFSEGNAALVCLCVLGALFCVLGFHGAIRADPHTLFVFWAGILAWAVGLAGVILYYVFVGSETLGIARRRCRDNLYVARFGDGCAVNPEQCRAECIHHVETNLVAVIGVFGVLAVVILAFAALQARGLYKRLIFDEAEADEGGGSGSGGSGAYTGVSRSGVGLSGAGVSGAGGARSGARGGNDDDDDGVVFTVNEAHQADPFVLLQG